MITADPSNLSLMTSVHEPAEKNDVVMAAGDGARGSGGASAPPFHSAAPALTTYRTEAAEEPLHVPPRVQDGAPAALDMPAHQHQPLDATPPSAPIDLHKIETILPAEAQSPRTVGGLGAVGVGSGGGGGGGGIGGAIGGADQCVDQRDSLDLDFLCFDPRDSDDILLRASFDSERDSLRERGSLEYSIGFQLGASAALFGAAAEVFASDSAEFGHLKEPSGPDAAGSAATADAKLKKIIDDIKAFDPERESTNKDCATLLLHHGNKLQDILATAPNLKSEFC